MSSRTDSISTQQWARLQKIFDHAMELPDEQRPAYLDLACEDDGRLRTQVDALVVAAEADQELVGDLIRTAADQVLEKNTKTRSRIGSFKIIDVIGTGGMGVVYLGQRVDEEYEQQVAIKILHDGLDSDEALLRFKTERQILADLNHPNIARLLDGGQTDDELPYLVMEYIDGIPLVEYCDQRRLGINQRLDLFKQVCSAVAVAHRSLIVHRDIKPSNILVDSNGIPKLLDFGIAKVLSNRFEQRDLAETQLGDRLLTPDYASPEQVQGHPITTSSDIYSLGVLLYQLLCGTRPFRLVNKTPAEMEKIILGEAPVPPSKAVGTVKERTDASRAVAADRRSMSLDRLQRKLAGELDYIALMALKKEPQRRYASASQMAADVTRYQKGQPIVAVRDTRRYHAKKFIQRNLIPVSAAAVLLISLLGFSVMTYQQSKLIAIEKGVSENALDFLTQVFESSNPGALQKEVVTAIDILDVGAAQIEEQLQDQPAPRAKLQRIIGLAYASNGKSAEAFAHIEAALKTSIEVYGDDHPYTADLFENLGGQHKSEGRQLMALPLFEQALEIFRNSVSRKFFRNDKLKGRHAIVNTMANLADVHTSIGNMQIAEQYIRDAIVLTKGLDEDARFDRDEPRLWSALSTVLSTGGKQDEADEAMVKAIDLARSRFGDEALYVAGLTDLYGQLKHGQDQLDEAGALYRQAIAMRVGKISPSSSEVIGTKQRLGRLLRDQNLPKEAILILLQVDASNREYYGDELPFSVGADLIELSRVYRELQQFGAAEAVLEEAYAIYMRTSGKRNTWFAEVLREQGNLFVAAERPLEAVAKFDESVEMLRDLLGDDHWQTAVNLSEKAEAHIELGQFDLALELLNMAIPVLESKLGAHHRLARAAVTRFERVAAANNNSNTLNRAQR